ncbi:hypothetical protein GCM10008983_28110 [Lentibacillus halophilus]|uniref:Abi-like protein n=1 Tax=Lentibacillus halophilus TaxID=295065 RepID=A0ABP3JC42_9BACI
MVKGKRTDGLMIHLRDNAGINISGSKQKQELLNIGYYHGYKGYRFIKKSTNPIPFTDFDEVSAIYNFDMNLKTLFYPYIMTIETAVKNYTLNTLVSFGKMDLESAFKNFFNDYRAEITNSQQHKNKMKDYLKLQKKVYSQIQFNYPKNEIITHHLHNGDAIPLWAVFEVLDMGNFGLLLKCLNKSIRIKNCQNLALTHASLEDDGRLIENIIFNLKGLRNAIAHNNVIFDCRFSGNTNVNRNLKSYVNLETEIKGIHFKQLIDYMILIVILLKNWENQKLN